MTLTHCIGCSQHFDGKPGALFCPFCLAPQKPSDRAYEHVPCATCGRSFQRIDFRCAAHLLLCDNPVMEG